MAHRIRLLLLEPALGLLLIDRVDHKAIIP